MCSVHYYDHPVLWSEGRKRFEERKIAQESIGEWQKRKELKRLKTLSDKEQYQRMIREHYPWGKPGGGAPNKNIRMRNILRDGLFPKNGDGCRNLQPPYRYRAQRGGGGGAPIRSASGRLVTTFVDDPILGFNDPLRNYVDNELRYKTSPRRKKHYRMQLDELVADKTRARISKKRISMDVDKKLHLLKEPWGRPGPGGKPWRPPRSVGNKFLQSLGWTDKYDLQNLDSEAIHDPTKHRNNYMMNNENNNNNNLSNDNPYEKDVYKDKVNEMLEQIKEKNESKYPTLNKCCPKCTCSCLKDFIEHDATKLKKANKNKVQFHQKHASKNCLIEPKARPCMITGGVELVPLLAKRRAEYRPVSLSTTDVTRYKDGKGEWKDCGVQYLNDLNRQIMRKERDSQFSKEFEVQTSKQHFDTWNSLWGRPGHGAQRDIKNRLKLDDLLYKVPIQ